MSTFLAPRKARSVLAYACRDLKAGRGSPKAVETARAALTAANVAHKIEQALRADPPLTESQRWELARLLVTPAAVSTEATEMAGVA